MPTDPPIACSLTAADLPARVDEIAALGRDALVAAHAADRRALLRFAAHPGVRERVDALVAAESRCCAFLTMRVEQAGGEVALTVDAPPGAEHVLRDMVRGFCAG